MALITVRFGTLATTIVVASAILCLLAPEPGAAQSSNILLFGETLLAGDRLAYGNYTFVMQRDCNLVLYNGGWQSNTVGRGRGCRLALEDDGRLVVRTGGGSTVWSSPTAPSTHRGKYAAVLDHRGRVVVYGPAAWSTAGELLDQTQRLRHRHHNLGCIGGGSRDNCIAGDANNVLFSGDVLYGGGRLTSGKHQFVMRSSCDLVLDGGVWKSDTRGNGDHCFLRLDHRGGLSVVDDGYKTVWSNGVRSRPGDYAAVLLRDGGKVVVYGPAIWATGSAASPADSSVEPATAEE